MSYNRGYESRSRDWESESSRECRRTARLNKLTDFLINRAALRRVTTMQEVQRYLGGDISREKVGKLLCQVAKNTWENDGVLLPAVVVHFNDNRPGHRFQAWAQRAGLLDSALPVETVHKEQLQKVFNKYSPSSASAESPCESGTPTSSSDRWARPGSRQACRMD